ncbi:adenylate kinase [Vibrio parahaemolyticus]|nr:adenylate kinase [Vibrio parahaemolyticus]EJE8566539.1 adenylate kinase [Vibrio parahaemolyticus]ELA9304309.1 adenylate kinase [Vibrio parahaemolyticus]ELB7598088.1 adenylate kinase [Vibrio parahaemolyticus]HAS6478295.1 adenylate kinase [Vibrio parahaemolyticus]
MKIAFMGISGSGKDFLASYLISNHNFIRLSFSDQLKRLANHIYPWMKKDYAPEEKTIPINITLSTGESINHSPRDIWISLNKLRKIEDKIFIRMLSEELKALEKNGEENKNIIITDIRSCEELMWCKDNNFTIVHIERENNDYEKYDIDKHVNENKSEADYQFKNNKHGTDSFKNFFEEVLLSGY